MLKFQPGDEVIIKEKRPFCVVYRPDFIIDMIERRSIFVKSNLNNEQYVFDADSFSLKDNLNVSILSKEEYDEEFIIKIDGGVND